MRLQGPYPVRHRHAGGSSLNGLRCDEAVLNFQKRSGDSDRMAWSGVGLMNPENPPARRDRVAR
ncbi:MAG: hypothetical protein CM15mP84_08610 [Cellvibrionales bacterium]|nr:MAG: hypothetical protein CM15mP84_08610 [Cellvibrionales bacterium]